ncbi:recombinase family protein [Clostridium perfringens]|uniref:recombinase family protein n=1 Tax=Clostridium perfringens TaxID=1502 RepID=UPI0013E3A122|nr:recombinase family protein [Clostridium perfringens]EHK2427630.1 recombinase family protein [Clostridium perfringens]MBO3394517.1 recombinase family protein [Clostridium perfringens]MBO3401319.1 recombinase family protein [Clostridium perfringens]MCX0363763.1 recombinase family protein [Clostridium perfringens]MDH2462156.1 recombinase family protein [Clostridium perfringens]
MKCAIYIRVSTNKDEQKTSLINQKDLFNRLLKKNNWDLFDYYIDIESGTTAKRENLQRMIKDAEERKFDIILVKELSRLARNGSLAYKIRDLAQINNIQIIALDNSIDTLNNHTQNFGLFAWLYERESENTSSRLKAAFKSRANKGLFKGTIPPYGYKCENGCLIIRDDNTPNIVRRIFNEYLSGSSVRIILENPNYTGDLVQNKSNSVSAISKKRIKNNPNDYIIVENTHQPIISKEVFNAVQSLINNRRKIRPQQNSHLFSNLLFCADCGHGFHFKKNRRGYVCGFYNKLGNAACSSHIVREETLKKILLSEFKVISSQLNKETYLKKIQQNLLKLKTNIKKDLNKYDLEISKLESKKNSALDKLIEDLIDKATYDHYISTLNSELYNLNIKKELAEKQLSEQISFNYINDLNNIINNVIKLDKIDKTILNLLIDKIVIEADGTPVIHYKFKEIPSLFKS